ncbi:MAG: hypothetical protein ACTSP3_04015 [Candidatus Heimdallarchaeaceae archaeon]
MSVHRTWKDITRNDLNDIRNYLLDSGGIEQKIKSEYELWRIRFVDTTFTAYKSGSLHSTPSKSNNQLVYECWNYIDQKVGPRFIPPSKEYLIGLDETGKGELFGHIILTVVLVPKELFSMFDFLIGSADTKKRHNSKYWDELYQRMDQFRKKGFFYLYDKITPWHCDLYNLNKIMDIIYTRLLSRLSRNIDFKKCRIVLDDYNFGNKLGVFFNSIENQGAEIITEYQADNNYLEVKIASVVSKWQRELIMKAINSNPDYRINGYIPGSGNANDKMTINWLKAWKKEGKSWPWFVKKSYKTIRKINGILEPIEKKAPPINDEILSKEFHSSFEDGNISITSLSISCPHCGNIIKEIKHILYDSGGQIFNHLICTNPDCKKVIEKASSTLRYYNGYILPDSSAIQRNILSKDLFSNKLFEGFTILYSPVVRKECDGTPRGKKEFTNLSILHSKGIINFEAFGNVSDLNINISSTVRDEFIINSCLDYNAILLSADKSMVSFAIGKGVFTISL